MMTGVIINWYRKYFSDPEAVILAILLLGGLAIVVFFGYMLLPLLAGIVIAYLLEGVVTILQRWRLPRSPAVIIVYLVFLAGLLFLILGLLPLLSGQLTQLFQELPNMIAKGQKTFSRLPELYPAFISEAQVKDLMTAIRQMVATFGQNAVSLSLSSIPGLFTVLVYLVLLPVLVFFFLKDKDILLAWVGRYLPKERKLATRVRDEMNEQIGNYVRGKFVEILIVGATTYLVFGFMGLNFGMLLSVFVGLSVIIPFIGAIAVTFPIVIIAFFQWGWGSEFAYVVAAYLVIQALDGNVLVPLLFSEAVNLHPVAIITAVLVFGGIWGVWGVFFAIPLATLVKAVINAWPRNHAVPLSKATHDSH